MRHVPTDILNFTLTALTTLFILGSLAHFASQLLARM
jgi:hypothetical protein